MADPQEIQEPEQEQPKPQQSAMAAVFSDDDIEFKSAVEKYRTPQPADRAASPSKVEPTPQGSKLETPKETPRLGNVPKWSGPSMGPVNGSTQDRIQQIIIAARHTYPNNEAMVRLTASQAILESGSGLNSGLAQKNNFFGIKGRGTAGSKNFMTTEFVDGSNTKVKAGFAVNATPEDSFLQHKALLDKKRYAGVRQASEGGDFTQVASAIQKSGYATDPQYANKLRDINDRIIGPMMNAMDKGTTATVAANENMPTQPSGRHYHGGTRKKDTDLVLSGVGRKASAPAQQKSAPPQESAPAKMLDVMSHNAAQTAADSGNTYADNTLKTPGDPPAHTPGKTGVAKPPQSGYAAAMQRTAALVPGMAPRPTNV